MELCVSFAFHGTAPGLGERRVSIWPWAYVTRTLKRGVGSMGCSSSGSRSPPRTLAVISIGEGKIKQYLLSCWPSDELEILCLFCSIKLTKNSTRSTIFSFSWVWLWISTLRRTTGSTAKEPSSDQCQEGHRERKSQKSSILEKMSQFQDLGAINPVSVSSSWKWGRLKCFGFVIVLFTGSDEIILKIMPSRASFHIYNNFMS